MFENTWWKLKLQLKREIGALDDVYVVQVNLNDIKRILYIKTDRTLITNVIEAHFDSKRISILRLLNVSGIYMQKIFFTFLFCTCIIWFHLFSIFSFQNDWTWTIKASTWYPIIWFLKGKKKGRSNLVMIFKFLQELCKLYCWPIYLNFTPATAHFLSCFPNTISLSLFCLFCKESS